MMPAAPRLSMPPGGCDCHVHIYDPRAPVAVPGANPGPAWADVPGYRALQARLGLQRAVIVQPNAYGTDNGVTLAAVAALGAESTRGVAVVKPGLGSAELQRLTAGGIRGARVHMLAGGILSWDMLEPLAAEVTEAGWHIQLQLDGRLLHEREAELRRLPGTLVIDHIGKFLEPVTPDHPGFQALLRLLDGGRTYLKLAAAYEVSRAGPPDYADTAALAKAAIRHAPERMTWASNWPHVSVEEKPDDAALLDLLLDWAPDEATRRLILVDNPARLYGFA
ncbi:amidohydrolase family protein [Pararoseomonas indoligenes]|uniref:Amidohydrolase family protein n=1 Tax=Roseomonas indoligenes TaxID=2820811 RepID=A0A940N796_9PROT|nr:amidohydrolase family protein [Pararoseomonas indoligenes]MBP0495397.1 amidohydrolase family protein [Pararoseomonas indoligenes]